MVVLDDFGKKSDLPIYNNKLSPKQNRGLSRFSLSKILVIVCSCLIFWLVYGIIAGSKAGPSGPALVPAERDALMSVEDDAGTEEVFLVTAEGVHKVEGDEIKDSDSIYADQVEYYDLNQYRGSANGKDNGDVVLFLMPLRNAELVLPMAFYNLMNLTYDHSLIDIAFLVSDCSPDDRTLETVFEYSVALQNGTLVERLKDEEHTKLKNAKGTNDLYQLYMDQTYMESVKKAYGHPEAFHPDYRKPFRSITIYKKDFGQVIGQGFSDRHAVKVQGIRRKLMGRARNWLTSSALKPYHSWVYWRDVDIETCPGDVIEHLMKMDYDVMVPNVWRPLPTFLGNEQPYDLNSWEESDAALDLAKSLEEDDVIVEGYAEYPTWRMHLAYIRDPNGNMDEVVNLDGVGGVSILARASIFRQGVNFPAFTFENHAETEAFGKMARKMGYKVGGLPHYTIWHIYEPSEDDLLKISQLERQKRRKHKTP